MKALDISNYLQYPSQKVEQLLDKVQLLLVSGKNKEALPLAEQALDFADRPVFFGDTYHLARSLYLLGLIAFEQKNSSRAEHYFLRALRIYEANYNDHTKIIGHILWKLGEIYFAAKRYSEADKFLEHSLKRYDSIDLNAPPEKADVLYLLAVLRIEDLKYGEASEQLRRALQIYQKTVPDTDSRIATTLYELGIAHVKQHKYVQAEQYFQRALWLYEASDPKNEVGMANALYGKGLALNETSQHSKAAQELALALKIYGRQMPPDNLRTADTLIALSESLQSQRRYAEAKDLLQQALKLKAKDQDAPNIILRLGMNCFYQGLFDCAKEEFQRALTIREKSPGPDQIDLAETLTWVGGNYFSLGEYPDAERLLRRAIEIRTRFHHPPALTASSIGSLSNVVRLRGSIVQAEQLKIEALRTIEDSLGQNHPSAIKYIYDLGFFYLQTGRPKEAKDLVERVHLHYSADGTETLDLARALKLLGVLSGKERKYSDAELYYKRALAIVNTTGDTTSGIGADILNNLGLIYYEQGRYEEAIEMYKSALLKLQDRYGLISVQLDPTLSNLAWALWKSGKSVEAIGLWQRRLEMYGRLSDQYVMSGSYSQKNIYTYLVDSFDLSVSIALSAVTSQQATKLALTAALQRKGRISEAIADSMRVLREHFGSEEQLLINEIASINAKRASLYMTLDKTIGSEDDYTKRMSHLNELAERLESKLSEHTRKVLPERHSATVDEVMQAVPDQAVVLEFVVYRPFDLSGDGKEPVLGAPRYGVFILRKNAEPIFKDLSDTATIDKIVHDFHAAVSDKDSTFDFVSELATDLYRVLLKPIKKWLGNRDDLLIAPDGELNLISFGGLIDDKKRYLIEQREISYLGSAREIARSGPRIAHRQPAVIIGITQFDGITANQASPSSSSANSCLGSGKKQTFPRLDGAVLEAQSVASILNSKPLLDEAATESEVKGLTGPYILHVASHGFFTGEHCAHVPAKSKQHDLSDIFTEETLTHSGLLRSGLALAHANDPPSGNEDGILTALEVASLDLWGTQLVTLSACKTGVGTIDSSEGVSGLRRALFIAGSRSQVLSLWKVDDSATKDMMEEYYRHLVQEQMGRSGSLRQVQLDMLNKKGRFEKKQLRHPYYWASFTHSGDRDSLPRIQNRYL